MAKDKALTVAVDDNAIDLIERIAQECSLDALAEVSGFKRTFLLASAVNQLRNAITAPMLEELMKLQGSSLGFRTDQDSKGGYDRETVKECAIEVVLRGGYWTGNEFNIIASRTYLTKEYFTRKVKEFPGLTNLKHFPGVPIMRDGGALVPYVLTWDMHGRPDKLEKKLIKGEDGIEFDERIPVKVNSGMGADAVLGKAERKILAALYKRLVGAEIPDGDIVDELPQNQRKPVQSIDQLTTRLDNHFAGEQQQQTVPAIGFDLAAVESQFKACTTFTEIGKVAAKLRGNVPAEHKQAVDQLDELSRERVRQEIAARTKGGN